MPTMLYSLPLVTAHDPMGMRAFMGYNFGQYLNHWLSMEDGKRKVSRRNRSLVGMNEGNLDAKDIHG